MNDFVQNETFSSLYVINLNFNKIINFSGIFESQKNGKPLFWGVRAILWLFSCKFEAIFGKILNFFFYFFEIQSIENVNYREYIFSKILIVSNYATSFDAITKLQNFENPTKYFLWKWVGKTL